MKKLLSVCMVYLLTFMLAACGTRQPGDPSAPSGVSTSILSDTAGQDGQEDTQMSGSIAELPEEKSEDAENTAEDEPEGSGEDEADTGEPKEQGAEDKDAAKLPEDGVYTSRDDVALYIYLYGHLPSNFITKKEAEELGWKGGSLEPYAPGKCIGGSRFGNYEGLLPEKDGRSYTECDIDTLGADKRGAKRIVFSNDGLIYYTEDHYESFELLYGEE